MRIAFVGKGGSGKTSLTALFTLVMSQTQSKLLIIDADINKHLGQILGVPGADSNHKDIALPENAKAIKQYLIGQNASVVAMGAFRKSTPPQANSGFVIPHLMDDYFSTNFCLDWHHHLFAQVGTYEDNQVGTSCYHGSLAVLENILSHLIDTQTLVITDMVAGTDAFSNTLHTQFDLLVLVVEPTVRSLEVYKKYQSLAEAAGITDHVLVVGNKITSQEDVDFLTSQVDPKHILGYLHESVCLSKFDKTGVPITASDVSETEISLMNEIFARANERAKEPNTRLKQIIKIHKEYIKKDFVTERYGDVSNQIDENFNIQALFDQYGKQQ